MFFLEWCAGIEIDDSLPRLTSTIITIVKIGIPIILIFFGMLDMGKAIVQQKEDDIKKSQQIFIKRVISGVLVFFIVAIVQLVFRLVANDADNQNISECINLFINGSNGGD